MILTTNNRGRVLIEIPPGRDKMQLRLRPCRAFDIIYTVRLKINWTTGRILILAAESSARSLKSDGISIVRNRASAFAPTPSADQTFVDATIARVSVVINTVAARNNASSFPCAYTEINLIDLIDWIVLNPFAITATMRNAMNFVIITVFTSNMLEIPRNKQPRYM